MITMRALLALILLMGGCDSSPPDQPRVVTDWVVAVSHEVAPSIGAIRESRDRAGRLPQTVSEFGIANTGDPADTRWDVSLHEDPSTVPRWWVDSILTPLRITVHYRNLGAHFQLHVPFNKRGVLGSTYVMVYRSDGRYPKHWNAATLMRVGSWIVLGEDELALE